MDVTPLIPKERQVIESYGAQGFRISGIMHAGAVIVTPQAVYPWNAAAWLDITIDSFTPIFDAGVEILLIGSGRRMQMLAPTLRQELRSRGIVADVMDTGAACRTYAILLAEERRVAAALLPVV